MSSCSSQTDVNCVVDGGCTVGIRWFSIDIHSGGWRVASPKQSGDFELFSRYTGRWWGVGESEVFAEGSWLDDLALALYIYWHRTLESIPMISPKPAAHSAQ
ncbi:hypothetical protein KXW00_003533, partial [Aspergillus fumigatus]